jgi:hypothetical protein
MEEKLTIPTNYIIHSKFRTHLFIKSFVAVHGLKLEIGK